MFPEVIWDRCCCVFGFRVDRCPDWGYGCESCMGTAMYWSGDRVIVLNPLKIHNSVFLFVVLFHEFLHHVRRILRFPKVVDITIDLPNRLIYEKQKRLKVVKKNG